MFCSTVIATVAGDLKRSCFRIDGDFTASCMWCISSRNSWRWISSRPSLVFTLVPSASMPLALANALTALAVLAP